MSQRYRAWDEPRVFLGFEQPPLHLATQWVRENWAEDGRLDLSGCLFVLPTRRSLERLQQLLVDEASNHRLLLTPPTMTTVGGLPEFLYEVEKPLASDLCQQLAWCKALMQTPLAEIQHLFPVEEAASIEFWQPYAKLISDLHRRLANDIWSFHSVIRQVQKMDRPFPEIERWQVLGAIQNKYYELLSEVGMWDRQAARNVAVRRELCKTDRQIVMIGVADLNRSARAMLAQIRPQVSVLVAAPETMSDRFDEFGGLTTEKWLEARVKFPDRWLRIVDQVDDQAFAAAHYISQIGSQYAADEITIGVPDATVEPQLYRSLNAIEVEYRNVRGVPLKNTPPLKLMSAVVAYLKQMDYRTYAALVRHPDMFRWLCNRVGSRNWLSKLDEFQKNALPEQIEIAKTDVFGEAAAICKRFEHQPVHAERHVENATILNAVHAAVSELFEPLTGNSRPIADWTADWCAVLNAIYDDRTLDKNSPEDLQIATACRKLYSAFVGEQEVPDAWELQVPAFQAMQIALEATRESPFIPPPIADAIELVGWLDLALDDAAVMIVTGMNDEFVPSSENGHLFLPNSLCRDLGILDNDRRYARDAYALTVMTGVREQVLLIAGRRDAVGEPLKPSRLWFAEDDETVATRAYAFFRFQGKTDSRFWLADPDSAPQRQQLPIPRPQIAEPIHSLSVTSFRDYLKCPYRCYLGRILRLDSDAVELQELDGGAFGTLIHDVLDDFGKSDLRNSQDQNEILGYLQERLSSREKLNFGDSRLPAIRIQIEQIRLRLQQFAPLQAQRAVDGWEILTTERYLEHEMIVEDQPFVLRGTIDRVDLHAQSGLIEIWDYKSGDAGETPETKHRNKSGWIDLQLPLYRHLAKEIEELSGADVERAGLGYVLLPRDLDSCSFALANWSDELLRQADAEARRIMGEILAGQFWPPHRKPPAYSEKFAGICQDSVFERFDTGAVE